MSKILLQFWQVNIGKMDSPIEKWNLIIGNLALKQVSMMDLFDELL